MAQNRKITSIRKEPVTLPDKLVLRVANDISIRLMRRADSSEFFQMLDRNRSDLRQWLSWVDDVTCVEDIHTRYDHCLKSKSQGRSLRFFVLYQEAIVGMLAAKRINWEVGLAELSFSLDPGYRRRGIITRSCQTLIYYLSEELGIMSHEIQTAVGNRPSERVADKLGFKLVGFRERAERLQGRWVDHKVFANNTQHSTAGG